MGISVKIDSIMLDSEALHKTSFPEKIQASSLWEKSPDGYYRTVVYPRANFITYPLPAGADLFLRTADRFDTHLFSVTLRQTRDDYFFRPHLVVPDDKLWVSDGHRYLAAMTGLLAATDKPPRKILSIDLDYFARGGRADLETEVDKVLRAASSAAKDYDLVVFDSHEDIGKSPILGGGKNEFSYEETVSAIDNGIIADENVVSYLGPRQTVIVKPALSEFSQNLGKREDIVITNSDLLAANASSKADTFLPGYFDMIHCCTSPGYVSVSLAFATLQNIYHRGFTRA